MQTLLVATLGIAALSLVLTLVTHWAVLRVRARERHAGPKPPISVLKPLKGLEDGLYENLASLARQDYPEFEILFGCEDPADPALDVARRVMADFPEVPMRILAGCAAVGLNPKVNNLRMLSARARYDHVLVSDSNVRARREYLAAMAAELADPGVGMVSSVLVGNGERSLGARLDDLHMNTCVVRGVCGADVIARHPCVIGKSMLFRLSDLQRVGGFHLVHDVLAEDYVLGRRFHEAGFRVALSAHGLDAISSQRTVGEFWARHVRWSQMRRRLVPALYWFEPLQSPVPWLLVALGITLGVGGEPAPELVPAILAGLAARLISDALIARALGRKPLGVTDFGAILLKDVLAVGIWAVGAVKRSVNWRGNRLLVTTGSRLVAFDARRSRPVLEGATS